MIRLRNQFLMLLVFALAACASLGVPTADTFNKKVVAAYAMIQTVAETAMAANSAGKLSDQDESNILTGLNASMTALKTAGQMHSTDPAGAETKLTATLQILQAINAYLIAHQGSPA